MKKLLALLLALVMVMALAACAPAADKDEKETEAATEPSAPESDPVPEVTVMSYEEFMAAEVDAQVTIETYVQAKQGWWNNQLSMYVQSPEGATFIYNASVTEEEAAKLVPGTKIRVTGPKAIFNGLHEINAGATVEILEGDTYIAEAQDLTAKLGTEELTAHMGQYASFKGLTIEAINDKGDAFQYSWDGSGTADSDSDLYFKASVDGKSCTFVVEYYFTGPDTEAFQTVTGLKVGDKVDIDCFLYWYDGAQPHITAITPAA